MDNSNTNKVAKIENVFALHAQYKLTAKEQKVFYHLVTHLDPHSEKEFYAITIPLREIEEMLRDNDDKYGSFYEKMEKLCESLISKNIKFPSNIMLNGKVLKGRINFFSSIAPKIAENGETVLQFTFSPDMSPFLLELHHYVNLGMQEIVPMSNTHAIRMYSVFKSEKDRLKSVKNVITMKYFLEELKAILGIDEKYNPHNFSNFKVYVLDKIKNDINENAPSMSVDYSYLKTARKVTGVAFNVYDKDGQKQLQAPKLKKEPKPQADIKSYVPSDKELEILSRAKLQAYHNLIKFGIFEGIAYKQILPKIKGSEFEGYEDFFVEKAIQYFEKNAIQNTTKELKSSTFVTWWTKNKVFESGDVWADIVEKLGKHKKQLMNKSPEAYENRVIARTMTHGQFLAYIKSRQG